MTTKMCGSENPYGTGVCTMAEGHDPYVDGGTGSIDRFDHHDERAHISWLGSIQATENREPVLYSGWRRAFADDPWVQNRVNEKLATIERCPRCKSLVLTDDRLAHQETEENER